MRTLNSLVYVAVQATLVSQGAAQTLIPEGELDHSINYSVVPGPTQRMTLRALLNRPGFDVGLPAAIDMYDWLMSRFDSVLEPTLPRQIPNWKVQSVSESERSILFHFRNRFAIGVSSESGRIRSVQCSLAGQERDRIRLAAGNALATPSLKLVASELARRSGTVVTDLDYIARVIPREGKDDVTIMYLGCLAGTTYAVGPGVSGSFDKYSGLPMLVQFAYDTPAYEAPFRNVISASEGHSLAMPLLLSRVPWPAYRLTVANPVYYVPDFGARQIYRSPRHAALIAAGKRCLITDITAFPIREDNRVTQFVNFSFDSQTREHLATKVEVNVASGAPSGKFKSALDPKQMIALPDLRSKMRLVPVVGSPSRTLNARNVVVRQADVWFTSKLDVKGRFLWIEDKPYQASVEFTQKLLKLFPDKK